MLTLKKITEKLNTELNNLKETYGVAEVFSIYADGENHKPDTLENNTLTEFLEGVAINLSDSIIPANGLNILTQTVGVNIVKEIKKYNVVQSIELFGEECERIREATITEEIEKVRSLLQNYLSTPSVFSDEGATISMIGSQPKARKIEQRPGVGNSIEYYFTIQFVTILNGVNSTNIKLQYDNSDVNYMSMTIIRAPQMDGGAFSNSNGVVKNFIANTAFEIQLVVPALSTDILFTRHLNYLLTGVNEPMDISINYNGQTSSYKMFFAQTSLTVQGIDNAGQNITLVEALIEEQEE